MFKINLQDTNYRAKVVRLSTPTKHPNADKLQTFTIDFQNIITDLNYNEGEFVVYFPLECTINKELISFINGFENAALNTDQTQKGFFNKHARVRAVRLRQEPSQGFVIKFDLLFEWLKTKNITSVKYELDQDFDSFNDIVICQKYIPVDKKNSSDKIGNQKSVTNISRLVEGQFRKHVDTENLRKHVNNLNLTDIISITEKFHGTSFICGNVLVNKKLNWYEKLLKRFGIQIQDKEYDIIYSSRRVVKNEFETKDKRGFYTEDIWGIVKDEIEQFIPQGYILYGEIVGYMTDSSALQGKYDYGCTLNQHKTIIYRITQTNQNGDVTELTDLQIQQFCKAYNLESKPIYYYGTLQNYVDTLFHGGVTQTDNWQKALIEDLQIKYNEMLCPFCINKVPREGIVLRKENLFKFEAYKLKSFAFIQGETKQNDENKTNIEDIN